MQKRQCAEQWILDWTLDQEQLATSPNVTTEMEERRRSGQQGHGA